MKETRQDLLKFQEAERERARLITEGKLRITRERGAFEIVQFGSRRVSSTVPLRSKDDARSGR